jgi:hypothetical protein
MLRLPVKIVHDWQAQRLPSNRTNSLATGCEKFRRSPDREPVRPVEFRERPPPDTADRGFAQNHPSQLVAQMDNRVAEVVRCAPLHLAESRLRSKLRWQHQPRLQLMRRELCPSLRHRLSPQRRHRRRHLSQSGCRTSSASTRQALRPKQIRIFSDKSYAFPIQHRIKTPVAAFRFKKICRSQGGH